MTRRTFLAAIAAASAAAKAPIAEPTYGDCVRAIAAFFQVPVEMLPDVKTIRTCAWRFPDARTGPHTAIYWDDGYEPDLTGQYDSPLLARWIRSQSGGKR